MKRSPRGVEAGTSRPHRAHRQPAGTSEHLRSDVAEELFGRSGYGSTTTRAIAQRARVRVGQLHCYFDSKRALFEALVARHGRLVTQARRRLLHEAQAKWPRGDIPVEVLVMDEPSTGLAPKVVKDILLVIKALRDRGMGLLLIEQNVGIAAEITDRAYVMAVGSIVHEIGRGKWQSFLDNELLVKAYLG
ncbi:TetR family transcriptional regulator [Vineibacter terrae]|uniref:TetR family transcriptional regulator n=1 Tax=Vineibacter terrae TaxID=2586908 RepID=A0A5C8PX10_9HYPH|nr:TetR family transcriptional regulator [Vineibacter terrae]TXL82420.1 TetR family transcriptional regulator [Vineibacter terrae]